MTIGENIGYGFAGATQQQIEHAAKLANAHDFVMSLPDTYNTFVGEQATHISGGQKQRLAIARALLKRPKVLLLDEVSAALDNESAAFVQESIEKVTSTQGITAIVVSHRLSSIRNADRIAFVANGKVVEIGSHNELIGKPYGQYKCFVESQLGGSFIDNDTSSESFVTPKFTIEHESGDSADDNVIDEETTKRYVRKWARDIAKPEGRFLFIGAVGAIFAGSVYPIWGILFALMLELLFRQVFACHQDSNSMVVFGLNFESCDEYVAWIAKDMQQASFKLAGFWCAIFVLCLVGTTVAHWGFGMASERITMRVRNVFFGALVRQDLSFFDTESTGSITAQLQHDASRIHTFSGEPLRMILVNASSVCAGIIISLFYMWPFALVSIAILPLKGFAILLETKMLSGIEAENGSGQGLDSSDAIATETLANMQTVAALNIECKRCEKYADAVHAEERLLIKNSIVDGASSGLSMLVQQWTNAFQIWWGAWILHNYPNLFSFKDFLVSLLTLLFSLFGMAVAGSNTSDRAECEKSAQRITNLLQQESTIAPLENSVGNFVENP